MANSFNGDEVYEQTDLYNLETINPCNDVGDQLEADGPVGDTRQIFIDIYKAVMFFLNVDLHVKLKTNVKLTEIDKRIKYGQVGEVPNSVHWEDMVDITCANNQFAHPGSKAALSWLVPSTPQPFRVVVVWSVHPTGSTQRDMLGVGITNSNTLAADVLTLVDKSPRNDRDEIDVNGVKINIGRGHHGDINPVVCRNDVAAIRGEYSKIAGKTCIRVTIAHSQA